MSYNKPYIAIIGIVLIVIIAVIAIVQQNHQIPADTLPHTSEAPINIGVLAPLSDIFADYGDEIRTGVTRVDDERITYIFEDTKCDPAETVTAYHKLVDVDHVQLIIGPACGSPQESIAPLLENNNALAVVPSAASQNLYSTSHQRLFQIQYSLENESKFNADHIFQSGASHVGMISFQNAFSETHAQSFKNNFSGTVEHIVLQDETADISSSLLKLKDADIQALYVPDMSFFFANGIKKMQELNMNVPVYSTYVVELPAARSLVEGVIYSFPGDMELETEGGVQGLSYEAAQLLDTMINRCNGLFDCILDSLQSDRLFDEYGVSRREIKLKQIKNGEVIKL